MSSELVIFDFDGTLIRGDTVVDFVLHLARTRKLLSLCTTPLLVLGLLLQSNASWSTAGLRLVLWCLTLGMDSERFIGCARSFAVAWLRRHGRSRIIPAAEARFHFHLDQGHDVRIATGSIDLWVEPLVKELFGASCPIIGSTWRPLLGAISLRKRCFREEKLRMIEQALQRPLCGHLAYGNSIHDRWFLENAAFAYLIEPSRALKEHFAHKPLDSAVL